MTKEEYRRIADSGLPSFNPPTYELEQVIPTRPAGIPKTETPEKPKTPPSLSYRYLKLPLLLLR